MTAPGQARNAYPAMRIFIFGHEVSEDALSCTVNWADDTRAPSTATITLSDQPVGAHRQSRYTIEDKDLLALYPSIDPMTIRLPDILDQLSNNPGLEAALIALSLKRTRSEQVAYLTETGVPGESAEGALALGESFVSSYTDAQSGVYGETFKALEEDYRVQARRRIQEIRDPVKRQILGVKFDKSQRVSQPGIAELGLVGGGNVQVSDIRRLLWLKGEAFRYNFFAGHPIFHTNDPVRIFWRDPFNMRAWYHMFAGFITDWSRSVGTDGSRLWTFTCEDVLRILRYSRISTNPGIIDINAIAQQEDFVTRTFFNDNFTDLSVPELLYTLIFGPERAGTTPLLSRQGNLDIHAQRRIEQGGGLELTRYAANGGSTTQSIPTFGVGAFNFERSATFVFGPPPSDGTDEEPYTTDELAAHEVPLAGREALAVYQAVVDHQVRVSDLRTMALSDSEAIPASSLIWNGRTGAPKIEEVIKAIGENPHKYPIDGGRLIILAPASLGPNLNAKVLLQDFKGVELQSTFIPRLGMIYDVLQRIEFSFYATGRGDILCEMPLYDFDPEDFGAVAVTAGTISRTTRRRSSARRTIFGAIAEEPSGPYAKHYLVALRDTMNSQQTFSDEHIRTQWITQAYIFQNRASGGQATFEAPQVTTLRALVPQFGVRSEQPAPPTFIASPAAAKVYSELKLNQWNAEALTSQVDVLPQLRMGPNRPIEFSSETPYIATCRSVNRTLNWEGHDMTQTTGVNYTRVWDGLTEKDGKTPVYVPIGGEAGRPLNYAGLFQLRGDNIPSSSKSRTGG